MKESTRHITTGLIIVALSFLFFSYRAGDITVQFTGDENFYFESCKGILETGDWLTPRYYGKPRFQKPILFYWLVAGSFKALGANWFAARFPSLLLGAFTVLLAYLIAKRLFKDRRAAILSAAILATTLKFFKYTRFAIPDMALLFFVTLSFYIFIRLLDKPKRYLWMLFFLALALASMIKGPVGVIIPALSIAAFTFFSKKRPLIRAPDILLGVGLYAALTIPWFAAMIRLHGDTYTSHIWSREITHRVMYESGTKEGITVLVDYLKSLPYYIPVIMLRFLPWSIFLPKGIANSFSAAKKARVLSKKRIHILLLSWFFSVLALFTILGEKHSQYMLALSVPFALMAAAGFFRKEKFTRKKIITPAAIALTAAVFFMLFLGNGAFRLNNAILSGFAGEITRYGLDEADRIAVGSHGLIPQHLEAYLDRRVEKIGGKWYDPSYHDRTYKAQVESFFNLQRGGAFCVIRRQDFERYIPRKVKGGLRIIRKDYLWKRKIDIKDLRSFADLKEEYYLVTNK